MYSDYWLKLMNDMRRVEIQADMKRVGGRRPAPKAHVGSASPLKSLAHSLSQQWGRWFRVQSATRA